MSDKNYIRLWLLLLSLLTAGALLYSVRDMLPPIAFWLVIVGLTCLALTIIVYLHRLYIHFRTNHLAMLKQKEEVERERQARQIEAERWQVERAGLLLGQHLQVARIYPDAKGYMPTLVSITEIGPQYVSLPHPAHQSRLHKQTEQQAALPEHASSLSGTIPVSVRYEDVRQQIPHGHALLGISANGIETCDFKDLMTMLVSGGSSTGKSNTVAIKLDEAMRIGRNTRMLVIDPHKNKRDSLYNKIYQYEPRFLCPVAQKDVDIVQLLRWFKKEFERRMELPTEELEELDDILLICDEVYGLCFNRESDEVKKLIKIIAGIAGYESRGYGMYAWFLTQKVSGLKWLRDAVMTTICHKMHTMAERILASNDDREVAKDMDNWTMAGRVVVFGLNLPVTVAQMPLMKTVEGSIEPPEEDEMEELQSLPNSTTRVFQTQHKLIREDCQEDNGEGRGRQITQEDLLNPVTLKRFLNEAGKMRAQGMSIDAILKAYDLPPGGRNNQNLKALLDAQEQQDQVVEG